tara:strand:- start:23863 stop:24408 length:546 start_codon:yes stop_codon:yes gene_type:complete
MIDRLLYIFVLCVLIRSIKTVQSISQISGHKGLSASLIAIDTIIFLLMFKDVITNELTIFVVIAVALGYVVGYYLGSYIEDKIALGKAMVTIKIPKQKSQELAKKLKDSGFIFVHSKRVYSHHGKLKKMFHGVVYRRELPRLKRKLKDMPIIATVEHVKDTFGRKIVSAKDYLEAQKEGEK